MKVFIIILIFICAASTGISIAVGNYGLAALNFFCVVLNMSSYKRLCARDEQDKE